MRTCETFAGDTTEEAAVEVVEEKTPAETVKEIPMEVDAPAEVGETGEVEASEEPVAEVTAEDEEKPKKAKKMPAKKKAE